MALKRAAWLALLPHDPYGLADAIALRTKLASYLRIEEQELEAGGLN